MADELHIPFNREVNNQLRGVSRMESLELILRNSPVRYSEQEKFLLAEKKNNIYRELLQNITSKDLADGAWTVLDKLHAVHIPMAIGSSSKNTPLIVEKLGIGLFFDAIVDGNQISHSKPDPEVFLLAAEKLHQKPSDCLVVEDAEAGVKAALNGGFLVAGIGCSFQHLCCVAPDGRDRIASRGPSSLMENQIKGDDKRACILKSSWTWMQASFLL